MFRSTSLSPNCVTHTGWWALLIEQPRQELLQLSSSVRSGRALLVLPRKQVTMIQSGFRSAYRSLREARMRLRHRGFHSARSVCYGSSLRRTSVLSSTAKEICRHERLRDELWNAIWALLCSSLFLIMLCLQLVFSCSELGHYRNSLPRQGVRFLTTLPYFLIADICFLGFVIITFI